MRFQRCQGKYDKEEDVEAANVQLHCKVKLGVTYVKSIKVKVMLKLGCRIESKPKTI
jgi:hypothetical protein